MSWRQALSKNMRTIGFYFHPQETSSKTVIQFIENNYVDLKSLNPLMNILVRDAPNIAEPYVIAQYDFAEFQQRSLANMSEQQIESTLKELVEHGSTLPKFKSNGWYDIKREDEPELQGFQN